MESQWPGHRFPNEFDWLSTDKCTPRKNQGQIENQQKTHFPRDVAALAHYCTLPYQTVQLDNLGNSSRPPARLLSYPYRAYLLINPCNNNNAAQSYQTILPFTHCPPAGSPNLPIKLDPSLDSLPTTHKLLAKQPIGKGSRHSDLHPTWAGPSMKKNNGKWRENYTPSQAQSSDPHRPKQTSTPVPHSLTSTKSPKLLDPCFLSFQLFPANPPLQPRGTT